jgi:aspartate carbamoyltransferase catalytic subunit
MMLRVQAERMHGAFFPSAREYAVRFGLSQRRADTLPDHAVVLHPGPAVRGMEIASSVADSDRAAIAEQVTAGVHVRMAVLYHLLAGEDVA